MDNKGKTDAAEDQVQAYRKDMAKRFQERSGQVIPRANKKDKEEASEHLVPKRREEKEDMKEDKASAKLRKDREPHAMRNGDWALRELIGVMFMARCPGTRLQRACAQWFGFDAELLVRRVRTRYVPGDLQEGLEMLRQRMFTGREEDLVRELNAMAGANSPSWSKVIAILAIFRMLDPQGVQLEKVCQVLARWLVRFFNASHLLSPEQLKDLRILIEPTHKTLWRSFCETLSYE